MSRKYKFKNPTAAYFVSFATANRLDMFLVINLFEVRSVYKKITGMALFTNER